MNTKRSISAVDMAKVALVALAAGGCQPSEPSSSASQQTTASEAREATRLLKAGDPKVCNSPAVTATVVTIIENAWSPGRWTDEERAAFLDAADLRLHGHTVTNVDASLPLVSCEATFAASEGSQSWENRVGYTLKLLLDTDEVNVEVNDLRIGMQVLDWAASDYKASVVDARYDRERDRQTRDVCDEFMRGRGRWSAEQLEQLIARNGDIYRANGLTLGAEGEACDRLIRSDQTDVRNAARAAWVAEQDAQIRAKEDEKARRDREAIANRAEYVGPPSLIPSVR